MNTIQDFERLRSWWLSETGHLSDLNRVCAHPAYQQIIGLGPAVLPRLIQELQQRPAHWFTALSAITGEDPARGAETFEAARTAWLLWAQLGSLPGANPALEPIRRGR